MTAWVWIAIGILLSAAGVYLARKLWGVRVESVVLDAGLVVVTLLFILLLMPWGNPEHYPEPD